MRASQIRLRKFTVMKTIRSTNASHDHFQTNPKPSFSIPQTPSPKLYHPARASFSAPSIISSMILFCITIALSNITISSNQRLSCSSRLHSACRFDPTLHIRNQFCSFVATFPEFPHGTCSLEVIGMHEIRRTFDLVRGRCTNLGGVCFVVAVYLE